MLRHLLLAFQFFTRLPLPKSWADWVGFDQQAMRAAMVHWPAVGWVVGLCAAFVFHGVLWLWGSQAMLMSASNLLMVLAALFSTLATILLTGALHEDGLADVADALGGHLPAQRALEVMKDSRVGSYAVITLVMVLLLKVVLLASLGMVHTGVAVFGLMAAHAVSRAAALMLASWLPHIGLHQQSKTLQTTGSLQNLPLWQAALWCTPLLVCLTLPEGQALFVIFAFATACALVATFCMGWWFKRRLQGITGDCLGATQQVAELAFYAGTLTATLNMLLR